MVMIRPSVCNVCSKLNVQRLSHPLLPCREPLPCSTPPIDGYSGAYLVLGSVEDINSRRSTCDVCKLVAESLDKDLADLAGECRIRESAEFCNFKLPASVDARDPTITHVHLTQAIVIFDTSAANQYHGPALPWESKERDTRASHYILSFQTKAKSYPNNRDETAVSSQTEQEFLDTVGGRYVGTEVNSRLIRDWLRECECKHGTICVPRSVGEAKSPTFVIDVIQSCVVDTPSHCRYVALSYVWGKATVFTHLLENTQDLRKTGSLRSLPIPATIQDAMTLVHAIGERYLWVDSVCIIQDDLQMQQAEIMQMGSIYSKALFTTVAAAGDHANSGLPGVARGSREQVQKILRLADCELLTVIDIRKTSNGIDDTTWAQRAWTFQERVLSNRVLVFSESQVYWRCRAASYSEERALEEVEDIDQLHLAFPQKAAADCLSWESLQPLEYCGLYDDLLFGYRQRRLTYQTDILNAFNGVTEMLAAIQTDTFLWGLPESLFSYAITWDLIGYCSRNHIEVPIFDTDGTKTVIPIPSWSWAAWSGKDSTHHGILIDGQRQIVRPAIQFNIVNSKNQLVRIGERPWQDHPGDRVTSALWQDAQARSIPSQSLFHIGHLHFWTSFANVRAVRRWTQGGRAVNYTLYPSPDLQPDLSTPHERPEVVHQDFIVIAARGTGATLILLAIEWTGDVAYRVGKTEVQEAEWVQVKNRQWRCITLG